MGSSSTSTFNPKKKWLREACLEDLAKPLDQTTTTPGMLTTSTTRVNGSASSFVEGSVLGSPQKLQIKSMNLLRPTVLMLASSRDKPIPLNGGGRSQGPLNPDNVNPSQTLPPSTESESNRRWLGKMALMQLATEEAALLLRGRSMGDRESVSSTTNNAPQVTLNVGVGLGVSQSGIVASTDLPEYTQL